MSNNNREMDPEYLVELERQLEQRESSLRKLKEILGEKEELLLATSDKLCQSERRRVELENVVAQPQNADEEADSFVSSNWRAARLETENSALKSRLLKIVSEIEKCAKESEQIPGQNSIESLSKYGEEILTIFGLTSSADRSDLPGLSSSTPPGCGGIAFDPEAVKVLTAENVQLHVRLELEYERRIRTQLALDEAERNFCAVKRDLENKLQEFQELQVASTTMKEKHEKKVKILGDENRRLRSCIKEKELQIKESEARAKLLSLKAEEFEEMFNSQLETVKALQSDLAVASTENQALVHEMETLSKMFNAMEQRYVSHALDNYQDSPAEDGTHLVEDVLKADDLDSKSGCDSLQESCFKEVKTKNGTRLVLSVSKTFMKLKDLILEKKSLEERVEKMKAINTNLVSRVNLHEAKLFNITDELNKTWTYVSTLKLQHKQLHTSEQILRAELAEKRELLAKLREELEISRESWTLVKKKTAESEIEWRALRDEFAARRSMFPTTSSESGFSDAQTEEEEEEELGENESQLSEVDDSESKNELPEIDENANKPFEDSDQNLDMDPHDRSRIDFVRVCPENEMTASTLTIRAPEETFDDISPNDILPNDILSDATIPIFIPPLDYVAGVPPDLLPPLFPSADPILRLGLDSSNQHLEVVDENYEELYQKLIASTARSAALANRLAEIHRSLTTTSRDENDIGCGDGDDDDVEPRTEEDDDAESSDLHSESEVVLAENENQGLVEDEELFRPGSLDDNIIIDTDSDSSDQELEDLGLTPEAIERALATAPDRRFSDDSDDDDDEDSDTASAASVRFTCGGSSTAPESEIDENPPQEEFTVQPGTSSQPEVGGQDEVLFNPCPSGSVVIPTVPVQVPLRAPESFPIRPIRPGYANQDSIDETEDSSSSDGEDATENATAVTRFLIKTLPKQLSKLRNEKTELEERIQDLESRISEQNSVVAEMERRTEIYRKEAETARKWTTSIGSINFGKPTDETSRVACSCSRLNHGECSSLIKQCNDDECSIRNIVQVKIPGQTINWTIRGDFKDLNVNVYYQSPEGETRDQHHIAKEMENGLVITVDNTEESGLYILTICSEDKTRRLKLSDVIIEVANEDGHQSTSNLN